MTQETGHDGDARVSSTLDLDRGGRLDGGRAGDGVLELRRGAAVRTAGAPARQQLALRIVLRARMLAGQPRAGIRSSGLRVSALQGRWSVGSQGVTRRALQGGNRPQRSHKADHDTWQQCIFASQLGTGPIRVWQGAPAAPGRPAPGRPWPPPCAPLVCILIWHNALSGFGRARLQRLVRQHQATHGHSNLHPDLAQCPIRVLQGAPAAPGRPAPGRPWPPPWARRAGRRRGRAARGRPGPCPRPRGSPADQAIPT